MTLEERISRLEQQNRLLKTFGMVVALIVTLLASVWLLSKTPAAEAAEKPTSKPAAKTVRAERFEVVDQSGKVRISLGVDQNAYGLSLIDDKGNRRVLLRTDKDGPSLGFLDQTEEVRAVLLANKGGPKLMMGDAKGVFRLGLMLGETGPVLSMMDTDKTARATIAVFKDTPGILINDPTGKTVWSAVP